MMMEENQPPADDAVKVADLEVLAEEVAAFVDRQGLVNVSDLEILAEEIAAFVDKRIAAVELAALDLEKQILLQLTKLQTALTAPREIVTDEAGRPIGVRILV